MTKKLGLTVLLACVIAVAFGCASSGVPHLGQIALPDGSTVDYKAPFDTGGLGGFGMDTKGLDRYQTRSLKNPDTGKYEPISLLIKGDTGFSDSLGKQATVQWGSAAIGGVSEYFAFKAIRPSNTNVNAGNNSGNQDQAQGQGQQQQQKQGQKQGQLQGQIQKTDVKNTNTNLNTNVNSNSNHNSATGGNGGAGGQGGQGGGGNNH